ncbi:MAG: phenylalanine--tRNA ligase subunit alpha [Candidatus Micrarchaeota archaeon]
MKVNEFKVLELLSKRDATEVELSEKTCVEKNAIASVVHSLEKEGFLKATRKELVFVSLTDEGQNYAAKGTPERRLLNALHGEKSREMDKALAETGLDAKEKGIALQWARKNGFIDVAKEGKSTFLLLKKSGESPAEKALTALSKGDAEEKEIDKSAVEELKARKLVSSKKVKEVTAQITAAGKKAITKSGDEISSLTPQMLKTGSWKNKEFREYNLATVAAPLSVGKKHAYKEFINQVKEKLVAMGFKEVHGPLVELEFWNMDALFMAQDHPAREIHDVFQVDDPARGEILDKELLARVKMAHEQGVDGSTGWRYNWDPEIAARLVLRSQTTAVSARELSKKIKTPLKLFSIGRVFRPDEIDWKHFIEFNQCEGIVADESMSFRELLGYLRDFAIEVFGAKPDEVKFVPSYFPFTEPSVEMHVKIPGKGWAEAGGAGMFRPEMLHALGVNVPVLAWGLGIDRLAMIKLGITDIRDLFSRDFALLRKL